MIRILPGLLAAGLAFAAPVGVCDPQFYQQWGGCTSITTSFTNSQTIETTFVDQRVDTYSTRITAQLQGNPGLIYDQTFSLPFTDASVQSAILSAQSALLSASSPLSFFGPTQVSSTVGFVGASSNTVGGGQIEELYINTTEAIGPTTIYVGDLGTCAGVTLTAGGFGIPFGCTPNVGTPFTVPSQANNFNVNTHTLTRVLQTTTTTNTYLTTEHYNLTGDPVSAVPEPSTLLLTSGGLLAFLALARRRGSHGLLLIPLLACGSIRLSAGQYTITTSFTRSQTTQITDLAQRIDEYSTRLMARLSGGSIIFDQTMNVPFADPLFQSAVVQAQSELLALNSSLSFSGPTLLNFSQQLAGTAVNTVTNGQNVNQFVTLEEVLGPANILIGDRGVCAGEGIPIGCTPGVGTPFTVPNGTININENTHTWTELLQTRTTTNTFLTSETYEIVGNPTFSAQVPEPSTLLLTSGGLLAFLALARRRGSHGLLVIPLLACGSIRLSAGPTCPVAQPGSSCTTTTTSFTRSQTAQIADVTQRIDEYSTRLTGRLAGGSVLFDQTLGVPFGDPLFQSAIVQAQSALLSFNSPLSFSGPTLLNSGQQLTGATIDVVTNGQNVNSFLLLEETVGPASILVGDRGVCAGVNITVPADPGTNLGQGSPIGCTPGLGTPFTVQTETANLNLNTHTWTELLQTRTTTNTFLTSETYEIVGNPTFSAQVPEPSTLLLTSGGLLAFLALARRRGSHGLLLIPLLACGSIRLSATPTSCEVVNLNWCQTITVSSTRSQTTQITDVTQRIDEYSTRLTGRLAGGSILFDQTLGVPFGDPLFQSAILQAQSALLSFNSPLSFSGPTLLNSSQQLVGTTINTVTNGQNVKEFVVLEETIGPANILIGDRGVCAGVNMAPPTTPGGGSPIGCTPGLGTPFTVVTNTSNLNVNTHTWTELLETRTTTNTFLTSETYEIVGNPTFSAQVPEPSTWLLSTAGLALLVGLARRKPSPQPAPPGRPSSARKSNWY